MPKISAVIITFNEELFIDKCLASVDGIADEIVVVDSFSTDATEEICKKYNVRFVQNEFKGYKDQKNFALQLATHRKILSLDADEVLSDRLRESIINIKDNWQYDGYKFNSLFTSYIHFIWGFIRTYIINRGFLDGRIGFMICSTYAKSTLNKYKKLRDLNKKSVFSLN